MNTGTVFTHNTQQKKEQYFISLKESKFYKNAGSLFGMTVLSHKNSCGCFKPATARFVQKYFNCE
jgi:hypothetical protein